MRTSDQAIPLPKGSAPFTFMVHRPYLRSNKIAYTTYIAYTDTPTPGSTTKQPYLLIQPEGELYIFSFLLLLLYSIRFHPPTIHPSIYPTIHTPCCTHSIPHVYNMKHRYITVKLLCTFCAESLLSYIHTFHIRLTETEKELI